MIALTARDIARYRDFRELHRMHDTCATLATLGHRGGLSLINTFCAECLPIARAADVSSSVLKVANPPAKALAKMAERGNGRVAVGQVVLQDLALSEATRDEVRALLGCERAACEWCSTATARRQGARWCSDRCRKAAGRARQEAA